SALESANQWRVNRDVDSRNAPALPWPQNEAQCLQLTSYAPDARRCSGRGGCCRSTATPRPASWCTPETGMHPHVKALVYVAAVQPDVGESLSDLAEKMPPAAKSIEPVGDGFLAVNPDAFPNDFAADAPEPVARFMAISQVPVSGDALKAKATVAAWKEKPSYAVIPMQDRMINPDLERFMTKRAQSQDIELSGSHAIFLSHPPEVAALIEKAATAAK